ncbi:MAG: DUF1543 domain-containing protein [Chitinophagaceae bacterium]|nr:DUF1543 domain-containing protein [Chitinophagaceae bacterium]
MVLIGGRPVGRHIEQHDVFFGIAASLEELYPAIDEFWPEAEKKWHIDSWREINYVDGFNVSVVDKNDSSPIQARSAERLYFVNLGGYKENDMEEYHYKLLTVAADKGVAVAQSKLTAFYKHTGFKGASSHIDDKYSIDVDDLYELENILPKRMLQSYHIILTSSISGIEDKLHIGYLKR